MAIVVKIPVKLTQHVGPIELAANLNWVPPSAVNSEVTDGSRRTMASYFRQPDNLFRADHRRLTLQRPVQQRSPVSAKPAGQYAA